MPMDMTSMMPMDMTTKMPMKHHMWMWFHTTVGDTVLFDFWTINTVGGMILSCLLVFLMGLCFELIKWLRWRVEIGKAAAAAPTAHMTMRYKDKLLSTHHLIQTFLFGIQIIVSYLLMLVFMTFSIWLGLAVTFGTAFGYYLFGARHDPNACHTGHLGGSQSTAPSCCS